MNTSEKPPLILFDDFLELGNEKFAGTRLIILTGISGSGKTTALKYLADHHPAFHNQTKHWIWTMQKRRNHIPVRGKRLVVVDEIEEVSQLAGVWRLLMANRTVAVASHLSPVWFGPLRWLCDSRHFRTDRGATKIQSLLKSRGIPHTAEAISEFLRRHGASYVELECILERHPGRSLDQALQLSHKLDGITIEKAKNWKPMTPVLEIPPSGTGAET
ncbi:MAG: hypothetical protein CMI26_05840 [Opitutae bacterium]|nr:hypothetical protein [Opitutae bacterium]